MTSEQAAAMVPVHVIVFCVLLLGIMFIPPTIPPSPTEASATAYERAAARLQALDIAAADYLHAQRAQTAYLQDLSVVLDGRTGQWAQPPLGAYEALAEPRPFLAVYRVRDDGVLRPVAAPGTQGAGPETEPTAGSEP